MISVVVLTMLPMLTQVTLWPLHVAFLTARPALDILADQVAAGKPVSFPQQAGVYRVRREPSIPSRVTSA